MRYQVVLVRSAEREFGHLPRDVGDRVAAALQRLSQEPRSRGARRLSQGPGWRLRVGHYRILYTVDGDSRLVTVYAMGHRRDVYRR
jgi:mRNA interferase RelE/StbE